MQEALKIDVVTDFFLPEVILTMESGKYIVASLVQLCCLKLPGLLS